ncbi:pyridoxal phosphate-dependent aminotransferase [Ligilactobacillus sp. WILCCON 0076]|uniref:cysteine-S-conjugate beta-lyase n=1 Tax=Ligilactobacillus ubinensis TaxID=2876789 RepID=A0A9X2JLE7_9LACO|nr:MalY/PatB family protein [Ligilactobacillus ubinensis]MCP0886530.1 pyridoxal phosphate-dependent aminotransferase [Ligilactobacillus ubinensis]
MNKEEFIQEYAVERQHTNAVKWDALKDAFGSEDLLPLWVADTEFKAPKAAINALTKRVLHGAFGYSFTPKSYYDAYFNWQKQRYGIELHEKWLRFGTGVVQSLSVLLQTFTEPEDAVMVLEPVYYPFMRIIKENKRKLVVSNLVQTAGKYTINFDDVRQQMEENNVKVLIFCSPHNPVGRVWSEDELNKILELCRQEQVIAFVDEIHHDLITGDRPFVSALSVKDGFYRDNMVVVDAPSKTFNMAALLNSHVIIPNPQLRDRYDECVSRLALPAGSLLGRVAAEAAYREGAAWLDGFLKVVRSNFAYVKEELTKEFPTIQVSELEGTYLMWIDLSQVVGAKEVMRTVKEKAKLAVDFGEWFGDAGLGYIRMNLGTTPDNIEKATSALISALKENNA